MGSALVNFPDFMEATGPSILTSPKDLINEAVKNTYSFWRFLKGRPMSEVVQGGSKIRDDIMLDERNTFSAYQNNDVFSYARQDVLVRWEIDWRMVKDYMAWTDAEVILNGGAGMTADAMFQQFKDFKDLLERRMWTSIYNGLEAQLWAIPDRATMEAADGKIPFSIPAGINEGPNRLFNYLGGTGQWTTHQAIDPTATRKEKWKNQIFGYDSTSSGTNATMVATVGGTPRTLIHALDEAFYACRFERPNGTKEQYFEADQLQMQVIFSGRKGCTAVSALYREEQDLFIRGRSDANVANPTYAGKDIVYVSQLDTATLYVNAGGTAMVTEGDTNAAGRGPRLYLCNGRYVKGIFNSNRFFERTPVLTPYDQPFSHAVVVDIYMNNVFTSRMRHAVISPGAVTGAFPSQTYTPAQIFAAY